MNMMRRSSACLLLSRAINVLKYLMVHLKRMSLKLKLNYTGIERKFVLWENGEGEGA